MTIDDKTAATEYAPRMRGCGAALLTFSALMCLLMVFLAFLLSRGLAAGIIPMACGVLMTLLFSWRWLKAPSATAVGRRHHTTIQERYDAEPSPFEAGNHDPSRIVECNVRHEAKYGLVIGVFVTVMGLVVLLFAR